MTKEKHRFYKVLSMGRKKEGSVYGKVLSVPIGRILPNPAQPRKNFHDEALLRLADSILRYGILQPLTVRPADELPEEMKGKEIPLVYELIAGERRLRAAKLAGLTEVPCMVIEADDRRSAELAVMENLQREDLGIFEQATAIASLIDIYGLTHEEAASTLGISQSAVANKLRLLRLTPTERLLITRHQLSERHARALLKICDPEKRIDILREVIRLECNVSHTEEMIDRLLCPEEERSSRARRPAIKDTRVVCNTLDRAIDTIEKAGISVEREKKETEDTLEVVIRIRKAKRLSARVAPVFSGGSEKPIGNVG